DVIGVLQKLGADVVYCDPFVESDDPIADLAPRVAGSPADLAAADCTVIVTDHRNFDPKVIVEHSRRVVDARNLTKDIDAPGKIRRL
ncbi:MAG: UDP-N-acetyl-D-glucosamine dehydrogenase, partial [Planctomycetes bacterium]|nr:UDP-N-acetyl-D-glucosamine dehydrogenase [Planctomycetota bacterium]